MELGDLSFDLPKARRVGDEEQHAAFFAVADGRAENRLEVERAAREKPRDVRHDAGMIAHAKIEDGGGVGGGWGLDCIHDLDMDRKRGSSLF